MDASDKRRFVQAVNFVPTQDNPAVLQQWVPQSIAEQVKMVEITDIKGSKGGCTSAAGGTGGCLQWTCAHCAHNHAPTGPDSSCHRHAPAPSCQGVVVSWCLGASASLRIVTNAVTVRHRTDPSVLLVTKALHVIIWGHSTGIKLCC